MRRAFLRIAIAGVVLVSVPLVAVHVVLRASLPRLDGRITVPGAAHPAVIERDALGVPSIRAADREDLAFALGFAHAQDRFFQMDLSRRLAAGELVPLVGPAAAQRDAEMARFAFRRVARAVLAQLTPHARDVLDAYSRGVNAGLETLGSRPWEYWLLRVRPQPWSPEDTILVVHSMWWDLQHGSIDAERVRRAVNARLGGVAAADGWKPASCFLFPAHTAWDAPNEAPSASVAAGTKSGQTVRDGCDRLPRPDELDVRRAPPLAMRPPGEPLAASSSPQPMIGSNGWAVAGRLTTTGSALVASDMHLRLRVPTVWYRARLTIAAGSGAAALDLNGVTLPGAPVLVAGSNGHIAWAFTNSYGNWADVRDAPCGRDDSPSAECEAIDWLAAVPGATNLRLLDLEQAPSVERALELAPLIGIPHQNLVVGDREGHIAWTIAGRIPSLAGAGRNSGDASWIAPGQQPRIVDPPLGRIWTANALATSDPVQQRVIGGDEAQIGADYDLAARARQIRDDLLAIDRPVTPEDMRRIQLDDRAIFLSRWREQILSMHDAAAVKDVPARAEFRRLVAGWNGRADVDSVGYRLVREYREHLVAVTWRSMLRALDLGAVPLRAPAQYEAPLWRLVQERPAHLLDPRFRSWRELQLAQIDGAIAALRAECGRLETCTWGARQTVRVRHPLSPALAFLSRFLDMPTMQLPGDHDMPRVQAPDFGASERFAVSPGHEADGYIHIAGGQSGHPLSPFYRAGFDAWARGAPLPFLPGEARHRLVLQPAR